MAPRHPFDNLHERSFLDELAPNDLERLRHATRRIHAHYNPGAVLSNFYCDYYIKELGPLAAERLVKTAVDNKEVD